MLLVKNTATENLELGRYYKCLNLHWLAADLSPNATPNCLVWTKSKGLNWWPLAIPMRQKQLTLGNFSIPHFTDMHQMMQSTAIDVVVVLTESGNHAKHVVELASHGKYIVIEKPMALRLQDADAMIEACDTAAVKLFVVKQNRFNVPMVKLREAINQNCFGKLVLGTVRVRWCLLRPSPLARNLGTGRWSVYQLSKSPC